MFWDCWCWTYILCQYKCSPFVSPEKHWGSSESHIQYGKYHWVTNETSPSGFLDPIVILDKVSSIKSANGVVVVTNYWKASNVPDFLLTKIVFLAHQALIKRMWRWKLLRQSKMSLGQLPVYDFLYMFKKDSIEPQQASMDTMKHWFAIIK